MSPVKAIEEKKNLPVAKSERIIIQEFEEETLVYDLENHEAHCLNRISALIWRSCTGERTPDEIADRLSSELRQPVTTDIVRLGLAQLAERKLIEGLVSGELHGVSRRSLIKQIGLASAAALPLITSLVVPQSTLAQSSVCGAPSVCACNGRGTNGGSCVSANCITGCTCRDLTGCNPAGNHCTGICRA